MNVFHSSKLVALKLTPNNATKVKINALKLTFFTVSDTDELTKPNKGKMRLEEQDNQ